MERRDGIQTNFPPMEQDKLFEHLKHRIGIRKYIDFIRTIKIVLEEEQQPNEEDKKSNPKATYDTNVIALIRNHYTAKEKHQKSNGKNILDALKETDLHSNFLRAQIKEYVEDAHDEGNYFDSTNLDDASTPETFGGMTTADREVLNNQYILPNKRVHDGNLKSRRGKELKTNDTNDQEIQTAEDLLYDVEMQLVRNQKLQYKLHFIIDQRSEQDRIKEGNLQEINIPLLTKSSSVTPNPRHSKRRSSYYRALLSQANANQTAPRKMPTTKSPMEFSDVEFAALADLYGFEGKHLQDRKNVALEIRESLKASPVKTAKNLLPLLMKRHESLNHRKSTCGQKYMSTMGNCLLNSIMRNADSIKHNEYPFLSSESLLKDIVYSGSGRDPPKNCFMSKGDDVWTQLSYESGFFMQFEALKWHKAAFELLQMSGSGAQSEKLTKFLQIVKIFFDLNMHEGGCTRVHAGDFTGLTLFGSEYLYTTMRLYHVLLVRLYSAYLQAEVDAAEWAFRKHCDEVGKARLKASNPMAYLSKATMEAAGFKRMDLLPTEGTAEQKMGRFLEAVKKREMNSRTNTYSAGEFEKDVMWAIGVGGNKMFTMTRILTRIRESVDALDDTCFDLFEKYYEEVRNGIQGCEKKYEEVCTSNKEWLFKFQCSYSDSFVDDEWGSVGEYGEVGRVKVMVLRMGALPGSKRPATSRSPGRGRLGKKRRT